MPSGVVPVTSHIGSEVVIPVSKVSSRVATPPSVFSSNSFGLTNYNVAGGFSGTVSLSCPRLNANNSGTATNSINLTTFPSPFTLVAGTSGLVLITATLLPDESLPENIVIGNVSAVFVYGANSTATTGPLQAGLIYTQPAVSVRITVANVGAINTATFTSTFSVTAILLGAVVSTQAAVQPL